MKKILILIIFTLLSINVKSATITNTALSGSLLSTGINTSGSYTVPSNRTAIVKINCTLPVLNGVNLYKQQAILPFSLSAPSTYDFGVGLKNVHKIEYYNSSATVIYVNINQTATSTSYILSGGTANWYSLTRNMDIDKVSVNVISSSSGVSQLNVYYIDESQKTLKLKTGDILTYASGSVFYEEYAK